MDTARLTDAAIKRLPAPATGNKITYDPALPGFGVRVTAGGHRAFVLTYYNRAGRQRRYTIGSFPDWSATGAREEARRLKREIDQGGDPLAELAAERGAATVDDLIARFLEEHVSRKRPSTQHDYRVIIERHIRPALGKMKVAEVAWGDVDALHRKVTKAGSPVQANRVAAVASKLFALAVKWLPGSAAAWIDEVCPNGEWRVMTGKQVHQAIEREAKHRKLNKWPSLRGVQIEIRKKQT
jgi:hypothetical protein